MMPVEFEYKTLQTTVSLGMDISEAQRERIMQLNALDEIRRAALHHIEVVQNQIIIWHDKFIKDKKFQLGD